MPFDNTPITQNAGVIALYPFQPGKTGLLQLAYALEQDLLVTQRFVFDYGTWIRRHPTCHTQGCALGLAIHLWPDVFGPVPFDEMGRWHVVYGRHPVNRLTTNFHINDDVARGIFRKLPFYLDITGPTPPKAVARALRLYVNHGLYPCESNLHTYRHKFYDKALV